MQPTRIIASLLITYSSLTNMFLSSSWAQVKVFLDAPKITAPPQAIIADSEFIDASDEEGTDAETGKDGNTPSGKLRIDAAPGEVIQVPVVVQDGSEDLISYAFRVQFNKKVLRVLDVRAGAFTGFAEDPITNRATFESGNIDFTANNVELQATPDNFQVALVSFEVIGKPKQQGTISIRKTPKTDLTVLSTFGPAKRVRFQKGIMVRVK